MPGFPVRSDSCQSRYSDPGEVIASSPAPGTSSQDRLMRRQCVRRDRAAIGDREIGVGLPAREANTRRRQCPRSAPCRAGARAGRPAGSRGGNRPNWPFSRWISSSAQRSSTASSSANAGSNAMSPGWPMPISGSIDRLVRAALGGQGQAGRGRDQDEPRILVEAVIERVEAALDERIVHGADRQQPRAEQRPRQPQRREQQKQIALGDAEFEMLAAAAPSPSAAPRRHFPRGTCRRARCGRKCRGG